jgi:outer membrane lipoprotein-sorting protein
MNKTIFKILFLTVTLTALFAAPNSFALSKQDERYVAKAQHFLDNLKTIQGTFMQLDGGTSNISRGEIYISKPGKMLLRYVDPQKADFYLVGSRILAYDYELEQLSHTDSEDTAFSVFLRPNFDLKSNLMFRVKSVEEKNTQYVINLEPISPEEVETKKVSLYFNSSDNSLTGFERTDADDKRYQITFVNIGINEPLSDETFVFKDPRKNQKFPNSK